MSQGPNRASTAEPHQHRDRAEDDAVHTGLDGVESILLNHSIAQQHAVQNLSILLHGQGALLRDHGRAEHDAVHTRLDCVESILLNHSIAQQHAMQNLSTLPHGQGALLRDHGRAKHDAVHTRLDGVESILLNHSLAQQHAMKNLSTLPHGQGVLLRDHDRASDDMRKGVPDLPPENVCPRGVQLNVQLDMESWVKHYDEPYEHYTTSQEMARIPPSAAWVFIGARDPEGQIALGAFGPRAAVLEETPHNEPHESNGLWWYYTKGKSMGFSDTGTINQGSADNSHQESPYRLSWHLDQKVGGFRAGASLSLQSNTKWRKLVYYM